MTGQDIEVKLAPDDEARLLRDIRGFSRELSKNLAGRIKAAAQPIGREMIEEVAPELPRRGGLAYRIAGARALVTTRTGSTAGVSLNFRKPRVLAYIERGQIPHPVYGRVDRGRRSWTWTDKQRIREGLVTEAFDRHERQARAAVQQAVDEAAKTIRAGEIVK